MSVNVKKYAFLKAEKLKSKKEIEGLFKKSNSFVCYPFRIIFSQCDAPCHKVAVSVSKKKFRKAVDRNHLKRLMRESYRLNKQIITNNKKPKLKMMFIYLSKSTKDFNFLKENMKDCLLKLNEYVENIES